MAATDSDNSVEPLRSNLPPIVVVIGLLVACTIIFAIRSTMTAFSTEDQDLRPLVTTLPASEASTEAKPAPVAQPMDREQQIRKANPGDSNALAAALSGLAESLHQAGDVENAERLFRESLAIRRRVNGADDVNVATSLQELGVFLYRRNRVLDSEKALREALAIRRKHFENQKLAVAETLNALGHILIETDRGREADEVWGEALELYTNFGGQNDPHVAEVKLNLSKLRQAPAYDDARQPGH